MAQAGLHGLIGMVAQKATGRQERLLLGILLGSFIPDMDNVGVAIATLTKMPTAGLHRTLTHSVFFAVAVAALFYVISQVKKDARWSNLGLGLAMGIFSSLAAGRVPLVQRRRHFLAPAVLGQPVGERFAA